MITIHHPWIFGIGLLGNAISFMVFLAPLPTFIRICKKKSTEEFQSLPYIVAIFSCMLWIYYALLKGNAMPLITINVVGVIIETIYIAIFITYAPKRAKISTLKLLLLMNFGGFSAIVLVCHYLVKGAIRVQVFGWICVAFSISVFAAPLSVMRMVMRTKSVEYMPINLSICLTLTATVWFMYGLLQKDLYVTIPNVVGFIFGVAQMVLYGFYRRYDKAAEKQKLPEQVKTSSQVQQVIVELPQTKSDLSINNEDIDFTTQAQDEAIEVVTKNEDILQGPSSCNLEAEKIVGPSPITVELAQCVGA